jgi:hypothetical protein
LPQTPVVPSRSSLSAEEHARLAAYSAEKTFDQDKLKIGSDIAQRVMLATLRIILNARETEFI